MAAKPTASSEKSSVSSPKNAEKPPLRLAGTLPWHSASWAQFSASLAARRVPHAILLGGARGSGKRHFANQCAALLLCVSPVTAPGAESQACGQCKQCQLLAGGFHPDLSILQPVESRVIKIEQVRRLNDFLIQSPQVARRKVAIIDSADRLNLNAANALLKTLEEPVEDVVLLLLHNAGEPLLPTIRSRCQLQRLALPGPEQGLAWLGSVTEGQSPETLETALDRAHGAPFVALALLEGGQLAGGDECLESLRLFLKGERQLVEATASFNRLGIEPSLDLFAHWAVAAMKLALDPDNTGAVGPGREMLGFLARSNQALRFTAILDQVTAARRHQVYNVNPELVINDILLSWKALMPVKRRTAPTSARMG